MENPFSDDPSAGRHAFEWGLAALIPATALFAMTPIMLFFDAYMWTSVVRTLDSTDRFSALVGACVGVVGVPLIAAVDGVFAVIGLVKATRRGQPAGVPLAALLLSVLNFGMWIAIFVLLISIIVVGGAN